MSREPQPQFELTERQARALAIIREQGPISSEELELARAGMATSCGA